MSRGSAMMGDFFERIFPRSSVFQDFYLLVLVEKQDRLDTFRKSLASGH